MNMFISALTTAGQLTVCLIFLLIIFILEIAAFISLFIWRKKALKGTGSVATNATHKPSEEQQTPTDTAASPVQDAQQSIVEQEPHQEVQDSKPAFAFFAPFMLLSSASGVSSLRGFVYAMAIICMIGAVGAVATAVIFAIQISKKKDEPAQEQAQEPLQEPTPEPQPEPEPEPQPQPQPEPIVEVAPEPEPQPEPVVEEPTEVVATTDEDDDSDDDDDESDDEEESRIFVETDDGGYFIILDRSFTARVIQSKSHVKEYYSQIKNALLSYKKVSARASKPKESFRYGRATIACVAVRGKTLRLYLALDPNNYIDGRYKIDDVSEIKTFADTPLLIKISNERRCEYALELIEDLMIKFDVIHDDKFKEVDYVKAMPYESTDALVEKGLIVKKLAKGKSLFDSKVVDVLSPDEEVADTRELADADPISDEDKDIDDIYERSLTAKLMQSDITVKQFYSQLKNHLLSYGKVNARMTKKREVFRYGKDVIARMSLRSKTLRLYLTLDFDKYKDGKYMIENASQVKAVEDTPVLYRIANERRSRLAKELIDEMMKGLGAEQTKRENVDYTVDLPYKTDEELFHEGLIVSRHANGVAPTENK